MNTGELRVFLAANGESRRLAIEGASKRIEARIAECADPYDEPEEQYLAGLRDALKLLHDDEQESVARQPHCTAIDQTRCDYPDCPCGQS